MLTRIALCMLIATVLFSCADDKVLGKKVTEVDFSSGDFADLTVEVNGEKDLCQWVDLAILEKHFGEIVEPSMSPMGLDRFGGNNGGCKLAWFPEEDISRQRADNYFHPVAQAAIEVKFNSNPNPSQIERFTQKSMNSRVQPPKDDRFTDELDTDYYKVNGVGTYAVWNDGTSTLDVALGDDHLLAIGVKYPLPNEERVLVARDIALGMIANFQ